MQIDGAIDSNTSTAENLTIISGTGNLVVDGAIGANVNLGTIDINSGTADGDGDVTVAAIGASGSSGATGAIAIGNTATDVLTLDGQIYESASTQTYTAKTGAFSILLKPGDGTNDTVAFTTNAGNIKFATGDVELYGDTTHTIDTGAGGGTVIFDGDIQSGDDGNNDILVIKSGDGAVTITGHIGNTKELGGLLINDGSGGSASEDGTITISNTIGNGGAGVIGTTTIGNTKTDSVSFGSSLYSFDGTTTITSETGSNINVAKTGGATVEFETSNDSFTFATEI